MTQYEPIIGLEVHAELQTNSKMFCGCAVVDSTEAEPNSNTCEICTGMPGTLPVINKRAVEYGIRVGLALHCTIAETSVFARKNYFYPDLPKGFQISQYELPLAENGWLPIQTKSGEKRIRIRRVHLEEDTGKLFHQQGHSLVDFNRSGVPLLEIVTEPDLGSVEEARAYATRLRSILRYLQVNSGDMEKGVIRFEANVSIRPRGSDRLGTRTEIKNLNSFRAMERGLAYEIERQSILLDEGKTIAQETLGWDENHAVTVSQRGKEEAHDYRYLPEPDLPPMKVDLSWVEEIRASLPELPYAKQKRFIEEFGISAYAASVLTTEQTVALFFESSVKAAPDVLPEKIANWLSGDLFALMNEAGLSIDEINLQPDELAALVALVEQGVITARSGKVVLEAIFREGGSPQDIVKQRGLAQISDHAILDALILETLQANPDQVDLYLAGKTSLDQWFFGQVMAKTRGRANPGILQQRLKHQLRSLEESPNAG